MSTRRLTRRRVASRHTQLGPAGAAEQIRHRDHLPLPAGSSGSLVTMAPPRVAWQGLSARPLGVVGCLCPAAARAAGTAGEARRQGRPQADRAATLDGE